MKRTLLVALALLVVMAGTCVAMVPTVVDGPGVDGLVITEIVVTPLDPGAGPRLRFTAPRSLDNARVLFESHHWWKSSDELVPTHRVELLGDRGESRTYWVGTFSYPPRFPCYWFCTGYWAAALNPDGSVQTGVIKPLASSDDMFRLLDLLHPVEPASQPNSAVNPPHSVVTALAQRSKRRAAGRAGHRGR